MRYSASGLTDACWPTLALFLVFAGSSSAPSFAQQDVAKDSRDCCLHPPVHTSKRGRQLFPATSAPGCEASTNRYPKGLAGSTLRHRRRRRHPPVDPFNYDRGVTSFPIGNGEIGLGFASFDAMTEGSMAAAEGRDVFLIYDPSEGRLRPGGLDLGITKQRYRVDGCFRAEMVHLLIADTNKDVDIGAVKEEIWCPEIGEDEDNVPGGASSKRSYRPSLRTSLRSICISNTTSSGIFTPRKVGSWIQIRHGCRTRSRNCL